MDLDIRLPIACLFLLVGALLIGYGFLGPAPISLVHQLPFSVNVAWGAVMVLFGAILLAVAKAGRRRT